MPVEMESNVDCKTGAAKILDTKQYPRRVSKSVIGFESVTSPAVLKLLKAEAANPEPVAILPKSEKLLKEEAILNLQGREVLCATGVFFLLSLSVAFIFIVVSSSGDKTKTFQKQDNSSLTKKECLTVGKLSTCNGPCSSRGLNEISEEHLEGSFGRKLKKRLCEITISAICLREVAKNKKRSTKKSSIFKTKSIVRSNFSEIDNQSLADDGNAEYDDDDDDDLLFNVTSEIEIQKTDFQNNDTVERIDYFNENTQQQNNFPKFGFLKTKHIALLRFWKSLQSSGNRSRICLEKMKMAGMFFKKCSRRRKIPLESLFSFIFPNHPTSQPNSLKFFYIETFQEHYGLETYFRFKMQKNNKTVGENPENPSNIIEILPPESLPSSHSIASTLKYLQLLPVAVNDMKMVLLRTRYRIERVLHNMKTNVTTTYNVSSLQLLHPHINWSKLLMEKFNRDDVVLSETGDFMKQVFVVINFTLSRDVKIFIVWKLFSSFIAQQEDNEHNLFFRPWLSWRSASQSDTMLEDICQYLTIQLYLKTEFSEHVKRSYVKPFSRILQRLHKFHRKSLLCNPSSNRAHPDDLQNLTIKFHWDSPEGGGSATTGCLESMLEMFNWTKQASFWDILLRERNLDKNEKIQIGSEEKEIISYNNSSSTIHIPYVTLLRMYTRAKNNCNKIARTAINFWSKTISLVGEGS